MANFYLDGIRMIDPDCTIQSKANMIAHAVREIDGGLRDVFAPKKIKKEISENITGVEEDTKEHFSSILAAIGKEDPKDALANKWLSIAKNFHRIAHRKNIHGATSVDPTEIINLWGEYEKVLSVVIGTFLGRTNRMDVLLKLDEPQHDSLPALTNILNNPKNADYFFSRLDKTGWLLSLMSEGYFDPANAPVETMEGQPPPYWHAVKYLLGISLVARRNVKENIKKIVRAIMQAYCDDKIGLHPYTSTDITQIMINVDDYPFGELERKFFEKYSVNEHQNSWSLVHSNLSEGFAAKLVNRGDIESLKQLLDYFFGFTTFEEKGISFFDTEAEPYTQKRPNVRDHFIQELISLHGDDITGLIGPVPIQTAIQKLADLVRIGSHSLTHGTPASIEPTSQSVYGSGWETTIIYFIRDYAPKLNPLELGNVIDEMLAFKVQILQRLAIHLIRLNFASYQDRWWKFLKEAEPHDDIYIHEPYILLKEHSASFTDEQFGKVIAWVEKTNPPLEELQKEYGRDFAAYRMRRWLTALTPHSQKSKSLLEAKEKEYMQRNSSQMTEHPEFDSWGESKIGFDYPIEYADFQKLSVTEQTDFIKSFKPQYEHDTTEQGLAEQLRAAVANDPMKYLFSLDEFIPLQSLYTSNLLEGFTTAIRKDRLQDFPLVVDFTEKKLGDKSFEDETDKNFHNKRWFATSASEFISAVAANNDRLGLVKEDLGRLTTLVLSMIDTTEFQDHTDQTQSGYINHILNSTPGRLYGVLIDLVRIWSEKFTSKDQESKWPDAVKEHFTNRLNSTENRDKEFSIVLGMELPLLLHWDKKWVEANLDRILSEENPRYFDYRFQSVFSRRYQHSAVFYDFLKKHKIFDKALAYFTSDSPSLDAVILYGLLEWKFWKGEPVKDSIIAEILAKKNPEQIKRLIRQAWEQKILSSDELIYLWERLLPLFDSVPDLKDHISILLWFFDRLPELTEKVFQISSFVISNTTNGREVYSFLRHLYQIADSNIELAGKLVEQIYSQKLVTAAFHADLTEFVKKLYEKGFKEIANKIAVEVAEQGNLVLKELYNKNN
ncbi:MAG: hypothetical protein JNK27_00040 [Chitinophagaceae bacterium]|nr:hypothetical protein [Chitinophagaceae bacterium]